MSRTEFHKKILLKKIQNKFIKIKTPSMKILKKIHKKNEKKRFHQQKKPQT